MARGQSGGTAPPSGWDCPSGAFAGEPRKGRTAASQRRTTCVANLAWYVTAVAERLAHDLHVLITRLDRAADRILREGFDVSYRRFLALAMLEEFGPGDQRALAERLGTTEPSVSRMTGVLAREGLILVDPDPAGGNRRRLELTPQGRQLVQACQQRLEERFRALVARSGVSYADYAQATRKLLTASATEQDSRGAA